METRRGIRVALRKAEGKRRIRTLAAAGLAATWRAGKKDEMEVEKASV